MSFDSSSYVHAMAAKTVLKALSAVALAIAGACSAQTPPGPPTAFEYAREADGLMFSGAIGRASVEMLVAELQPGEPLIINSPGGDRTAALDLARLLAERTSTVVVNGECFSACALYLALGAAHTDVREGAILLFHNDTAMWMTALERRPDLFDEAEREAIIGAHQDLIDLLSSRGINPAILGCISSAIGPRFGFARRARSSEWQAGSDVEVIIPTRVDWVWLSQDVLEHFGAGNVFVSWSLAPSARSSYAAMRGMSVAWIDSPDQCR